MFFGQDVDFGLCAYNPRFERIPRTAAVKPLYMCTAFLAPDGSVEISQWSERLPSARRAPFSHAGACVFAFRYQAPETPVCDNSVPVSKGRSSARKDPKPLKPETRTSKDCGVECRQEEPSSSVYSESQQHPPSSELSNLATAGASTKEASICDCCAEQAPNTAVPEGSPEVEGLKVAKEDELEAVYEEVDWVTLEHMPIPPKSRGSVARQVESVRRAPFQLTLASLHEDRSAVRAELSAWLGSQASALDQQVGLIEVFTSKAPLAEQCSKLRGLVSIKLGTTFGQDFTRARDRRLLLLLIGFCRPKDIWFAWPCSCWSGWARMNIAKGPKAARQVFDRRRRERCFLRLFETMQGGHVHAENPTGSQAWQELQLGPAFEVDLHMCGVGLVCGKSGLPILKPTRMVTSDPGLVVCLRACRCPGHTAHAHLEGGSKTRAAEVYPRKFCYRVARYFASRDGEIDPSHDIFLNTDDEADSEREEEPPDAEPEAGQGDGRRVSYAAMINKLHVNTGHASVPQMLRLAQRARAPAPVIEAIRSFKCPICEELQVPPSHKAAALRHTETPNHIVGLDVVQVELKKDGPNGVEEQKFNVLTAVDYASDFAQQILIPAGPCSVSRAFHDMWCRPYGPPRVVYVDPDQRWMSGDFQKYLRQNSIVLLDSASESHWQLGRVEIAQKILRRMAQRVWRTAERPPHEVIESCAGVRNEQLKRHGFSSAQWFLGREPRVPGSLADVTEQGNAAVQDAVHSEQDFAQKMQVRLNAAEAFMEAHAHTTWTRAIRGRTRPLRGPYVVGQSVYVFRKTSRHLLSTRHGTWLGPGRVVGTESYRDNSPVARVIWVVVNGFMYKCSPECLRPVPEDEVAFRQVAQEYCSGRLPDELEQMTPARGGPAGRFFDLTGSPPLEEDFQSAGSDLEDNGRNVRRRITHSDGYWARRAAGESTSPRGQSTVRDGEGVEEGSPSPKSRRVMAEEDTPRPTPQPNLQGLPSLLPWSQKHPAQSVQMLFLNLIPILKIL